ncbi:EAL domain-containing protein [Metabacillus sp. GX 13764]|uniref:putative bifunctional diguanylate cyclase/phosphodiesterase n=1 Tax=Metabacillus kandeliae TaxID=2900151 RepID=UPI001E5E3F3E|nr:EAL domain-containing protein [Metabacillus kandeliae]MCD7034510.1 EAL domain-containing protein [Metabacillus kandeliae]
MTHKQLNLSDAIQVLVLILLSLAGNIFSYQLFFGIDFVFGSIFSFLAARMFGFKTGLAAVIVSSLYTLFLWHHLYGAIAFILELILVYTLSKRKSYSFILIDVLYWLIIGIPIILLSYSLLLNISWGHSFLVALKDGINGIFNVIIFSLLHVAIQMIKKNQQIRFQELLFIMFSAVFLIPSLFLFGYEGSKEYKEELDKLQLILEKKSQFTSNYLSNWRQTHEAALSNLKISLDEPHLAELGKSMPLLEDLYVYDSSLHLAYYYTKNKKQPFYPAKLLTDTSMPYVTGVYRDALLKADMTSLVVPIKEKGFSGYVIGTYKMEPLLKQLNHQDMRQTDVSLSLFSDSLIEHQRLTSIKSQVQAGLMKDHTIYLMEPDNLFVSKVSVWQDSYFVEKINLPYIPWDLAAKVPIEPYQSKLYGNYTGILLFMLLIIFLALIAAYFLSRFLVSSIKKLSLLTDQLSAKRLDAAAIIWPKSSIREVSRLIQGFERLVSDFNLVLGELRKKQSKLEYFAHYDVLTNMHNRYSFSIELEKALQKARREETILGVMYCDLDRFKLINDSLGHEIGDELLKGIGDIIREVCGSKAILCRHGGDEFLIAVQGIKNADELEILSQQILKKLKQPIPVEGHEVSVSCSIGISLFPYHAETQEELLTTADIAMFRAKEKGKNTYEFFNPVLRDTRERKLEIEKELERAFENKEFFLYYQPQVDLVSKKIVGAEALVRWQNPRLGNISPGEFIPIAEETGFIRTLGEWVIEEAAAGLQKLRSAGYCDISFSVNISIKQFYHQSLPDILSQKLEEYEVPRERLKIEITESVVIDHLELVLSQLQRIKELGIEIALDDFGTGYSSLNYLKKLPIDIVKIDRSFIQDIIDDAQDAAIVQAVISIADSMNLNVIAEGIEKEEQSRLLGEIGCRQGQGFYYSRPVPLDTLTDILSIDAILAD